MKILIPAFIILLLGATSSCFCQDTINWRPGYKLTWDDFKAAPDTNSYHVSETSSSVTYGYSIADTGIAYKINCFFERTDSWKKGTPGDALLIHERGHFDISEIFARKLRIAFAAYKPVKETIGPDLKKIFSAIMQQRAEMQQEYEKETEFSLNKDMQKTWLEKIKKQLEELAF